MNHSDGFYLFSKYNFLQAIPEDKPLSFFCLHIEPIPAARVSTATQECLLIIFYFLKVQHRAQDIPVQSPVLQLHPPVKPASASIFPYRKNCR